MPQSWLRGVPADIVAIVIGVAVRCSGLSGGEGAWGDNCRRLGWLPSHKINVVMVVNRLRIYLDFYWKRIIIIQ